MRLSRLFNILATGLAALGLLLSTGCGGGNKANVITVILSASPTTGPILGQSITITATVTGATDNTVNWTPACQFTTTTTDSKGKSTTTNPAPCPPDPNFPNDPNHTLFGVFSNQQATGTEVFTAPSTLPDQTKYPVLQIIATAQSHQDPKKTGTIKLFISSGISVSFTPGTASVPVKEQQTFTALLTNDLSNAHVTWSLTQNVPDSTFGSVPNPYTPLPTCSPACGSLTVPNASDPNTVTYTAPDTVPTAITPAQKNNTTSPANVTIVAVSNADKSCSTCVVLGTITIIPGGPITFNSITPTIAPQSATLWDIYLDAPNISSASKITLTYPNNPQPVVKDSTSGQIKVLFPVPAPSSSTTTTTTSATCSSTTPCSTGARLRLNSTDLTQLSCASAPQCTVTVSVIDAGQPCNGVAAGSPCTAAGIGTFQIIPVRATSTSTVPEDIVQGTQTQNFPVTVDGGYFGPNGQSAAVFFQSPTNHILLTDTVHSTSRQLFTSLAANDINPGNPGLYPLYVVSNGSPAPTPGNPSVTNMAIFPDYSTTAPAVVPAASGIASGTNPSAVDIDPNLGVLAVAETGSNTVEFFNIGSGTLTSVCKIGATAAATTCPGATPAPLNLPTGVSINRVNHTVAVVNYGSQTATTTNGVCQITSLTGQSVSVLPIPNAPPPPPGTPAPTAFNVDLTGALQGSVCPAPMPYSIGVDSDSNLALVAYSVTATASASNIGFIVNLNPDSSATPNNYKCALDHAITPSSMKVGQCLYSQVTLNTGTYPQVALASHGHFALVTSGGGFGSVRGVDVTQPSSANVIKTASLAAGVVTVIIDNTKCPPPLPDPTTTPPTNPCPFNMVPGNAGSVLLAGLTPGTAANNSLFNGVFTANVTSNNSFTYVVNSTVTDACPGPNAPSTATCGGEVFYGQPNQIFGLPATVQGVAINPLTSTAAMADANATSGAQIDLLNGLDHSASSISFSTNCTIFTTTCSQGSEFTPTADVAWQPYTNSVVSYNPNLNQVSISDPVTHERYAFACASSAACTTNPINPSQIQLSGGMGAGQATLTVQNGTTNSLKLFGGLAVDPVTNQAFVVKSTSGTIDTIDLTGVTAVKSAHISEVFVPSPASSPGTIGGIPKALVPQAALACVVTPPAAANSCDLLNVRIFGSGFTASTQVRLDGIDITLKGGTVGAPLSGGREVDVTIPGSFLVMPHHYALDVLINGVQSNAVDFLVIQTVDLSTVCTGANNTPTNTQPSSVAIADQIADGAFSPIALISVTGCNSIVALDLNPVIGVPGQQPPPPVNPNFGHLIASPVSVGTNPEGIGIWQHQGVAVVANNGSNSASILDLTPLTKNPAGTPVKIVPDITNATGTGGGMGSNPTGVAVNEATGAAIVANNGSNTVSMINLGLLFPQPTTPPTAPPTTLTATSIGGIQEPIAVAIDPDGGSTQQGIAVVTAISLTSLGPSGSLDVVEIGTATPALSNTIPSGFVSSTPTGIAFDPAANLKNTNSSTNPGAFFANSSGTNTIIEFIPGGSGGSSTGVGVNPTSLAINSQTGALLTANSSSNTISIVDTTSTPFKTHQTLGIPGSPTFGVAIDQFTNLAVIVDQANMRVLLFPMPN